MWSEGVLDRIEGEGLHWNSDFWIKNWWKWVKHRDRCPLAERRVNFKNLGARAFFLLLGGTALRPERLMQRKQREG